MTQAEFVERTERYRRELLAHCYRMLGSVDDAEDLVQETYLRAWRGFAAFEERSSVRTWLYRIATNACLNALAHSERRVLPSGLVGPSDDPTRPDPEALEAPWLQPFPDRLLGDDPATVAVAREGIRLAFVAALQHLPARQRAVLILRDVLGWRAAEVAALMDTTTASVNSALQRARAQLDEVAPARDEVVPPTEPASLALLDRYAAAFANADLDDLLATLRDDVVLEMPPRPMWVQGLAVCRRFMASRVTMPGALRLIPTAANGQPAFATYFRADGFYHAHNVQVLTVTPTGIAHVVAFIDAGLFPAFGLPLVEPVA